MSTTKDLRGVWPGDIPGNWIWLGFDDFFLEWTDTNRRVKCSDYLPFGALPVVDQGVKLVGGFTDDATSKSLAPLPLIVFGDHTRRVKYIDFEFSQGADGTKLIRPVEGIFEKFAFHALRTVKLPGKAYSRHFRFLKATKFPLTGKNEQRRIVAKIEALQEKLQRARIALEAVPSLLEKLRQSVLAAAFRGDLTADWRKANPDVEPASELLERIRVERRRRWEEAELEKMRAKGKVPKDDRWKGRYKGPQVPEEHSFGIPASWSLVSIEELSWAAGYGTSQKCHTAPTGTPVLRIPNIASGSIEYSNLKYAYDVPKALSLGIDDFLVVRTNGSRDLIGRAAQVSTSFPCTTAFASYLIRYRLLGGQSTSEWISAVWASPQVRTQIVRQAATSAGQYNVSLGKLSRIVFPLPPLPELIEINTRLRGFARSLKHSGLDLLALLVSFRQACVRPKFFDGLHGRWAAGLDGGRRGRGRHGRAVSL